LVYSLKWLLAVEGLIRFDFFNFSSLSCRLFPFVGFATPAPSPLMAGDARNSNRLPFPLILAGFFFYPRLASVVSSYALFTLPTPFISTPPAFSVRGFSPLYLARRRDPSTRPIITIDPRGHRSSTFPFFHLFCNSCRPNTFVHSFCFFHFPRSRQGPVPFPSNDPPF